MPDLILKETGKLVPMPDELVADALASGEYEAPGDARVAVTQQGPLGTAASVPLSELERTQAITGGTVESEGAFRGRERSTRVDREHGGVGGKVLTGVESFGDELLLGVPSMVGEVIGGEGYTERRLEREEANPITSTATGIAGMVAPALVSGGSSTAARIAAKTPLGWAANVSARFAEGGVTKLGKAGRVLAGGALEGAVAGVSAGVQEAVDSDDPLTIELVASGIGHNLLSGSGVGAAAAGGAKLIEKGLRSAKVTLDKVTDLAGKRANVADDLARMERPQLKAAEDAEIDALAAAQTTQRTEAAAGISKYRDSVKEANPWLVIDEGSDAALLHQTNRSIRSALDDSKAIESSPQSLLKPLRKQEGAIERTLANEAEVTKKFAATNQKLVDNLTEELATLPDGAAVTLTGRAARRYGSYADVKISGKGAKAAATLTREEADNFLGALQRGEVEGARQGSFKKLQGLLDENRALQAKIEQASLPKSQLTSDRLKQIREAREVLAEGGKKSIAEQMLTGAVYGMGAGAVAESGLPGAGFLAPFAGAAAAGFAGKNVFGRMAQGVANATSRTSKVVGAFLDASQKVTRAAPVLATKVLAETRFAENDAPAKPRSSKAGKQKPPPDLASLYQKRASEIRAQVVPGPDGKPRMSLSARKAMAGRLDPIRSHMPIMADRLESLAARRVEFLANKLPTVPDIAALNLGNDPMWMPSDMEMRAFARYVSASEDPDGIEDRLVDGSITPEDAEVMRELYPERLADLTRQVLEGLADLRESLPYERKLSLSMLTGVPVDPSMHPSVIRRLQSTFANENGTEFGTQAPTPQPAFGSVRSQDSTPAQRREGAM